jgi:hypothetical protein
MNVKQSRFTFIIKMWDNQYVSVVSKTKLHIFSFIFYRRTDRQYNDQKEKDHLLFIKHFSGNKRSSNKNPTKKPKETRGERGHL